MLAESQTGDWLASRRFANFVPLFARPNLPEERKAALNAALESKEFSRGPALAKLLKYLCEKTFDR